MHFPKFLYIPLSIITNSKYKVFEDVYYYFYIFILIPPNLVTQLRAIYILDSFIYKMDALVYFIITIVIMSILISARYNHDRFIKIHFNIINNKEYIGNIFHEGNDKLLKQKFMYFFLLIFSLGTLVLIFPLAVVVFTDAEYGSVPTLIYPSVYPWPVNTAGWYSFTITVQIIMASLPILILFGSTLYVKYIEIILISFRTVLQSKIKVLNNPKTELYLPRSRKPTNIIDKAVKLFGKEGKQCKRTNYLYEVFKCHQFIIK